MKPECVCLIITNNTGPQMIREFPEMLFKRKFKKIAKVCLPYGAMEGNFITGKYEKNNYSSYVFFIISESGGIPAALVAVFKSDKYDPERVKEYFQQSIAKLRDQQKGDLASLANSVPDIYRGYLKGKMSLKVSTTTYIQIDSDKKKKPKRKENMKEKIKKIDDDIWYDESDTILKEIDENETAVVVE